LNEAAENRLLTALAQGLYDIGLDLRRAASAMPGHIEKSVNQHIEIAQAILSEDAGTAVAAYGRHLDHIRETTIEAMLKARAAS
jgi:GntR family transcriptional repressor for pyruvate dehydrogenase complex